MSNLKLTNISNMNFQGAEMAQSQMNWATAINAKFEEANLENAVLRYGDFRIANFTRSNCKSADLQGAIMTGVTAVSANFELANMKYTVMTRSNIKTARFKGANLKGAHFEGARANYADFSCANLEDVTTSGASFWGAKFDGCVGGWTHEIIAERLRQAAEKNTSKLELAGFILINQDWCWGEFLEFNHPEKTWALNVMRSWAAAGGNIPHLLQRWIEQHTL